jgi:N-acetylmuramoyl-L-alanine amidase
MTEKHLKAGQRDQTIVEIHVDSRSRDAKTDVFFYYRPESDPSKDLAQHIHRTFLEKYLQLRGQRGYMGSVTPRYLWTLQETTCRRAVYIELGNIRNDWDQQRLVIKNNRQAVANWLFQALSTH